MPVSPIDAALEVLRPTLDAKDERQQIVAAKCYGLMQGYASRWADSRLLIDSVESVMTAPLINVETGRNSRTFVLGGKLDVRATDMESGAKLLIDHKTTSEDIEDFNNAYWRILTIEGQVSHYMLLEWLHSNKVDYGLWDVVRKPGISPKALTKKDATEFEQFGIYFQADLKGERERFVDRETPMMYAARVAWDCGVDRPDRYFQRRRVPRLDQEVHEYASELWDIAQEIIAARANNRWPRSSDSCFTYGSPCEFLAICSGHDSPESENWRKKQWVHPELPVLTNGCGSDVLTNSRKRVFQACHKKAFFKYELGIEKVSDEETEARYLGTTFHEALEQYFLALQQQQKGVVHG